MNVVQCLSHSIEAFDMLKMYARIGVNAFDLGGYIDPANPHDDKRPGVPEMPLFPDLKAAVDAIGSDDNLRAAQEKIPDPILDWADVIVFHHYLDRLYRQWPRIETWLRSGSHRRVIVRTVGQSVAGNEADLAQAKKRGVEIVRYSPREKNIPNYAGEDAVIRFSKDPSEWTGWTGENAYVGNVTQDLFRRNPYTNYGFWKAATEGLPAVPAGPGSEAIGGVGSLSYDAMREYLRGARCYLYTGTQPASYTLGLLEAMMTGVPVVSIGPEHMSIFPYGPAMFEGHEIAMEWSDDPAAANRKLRLLLEKPNRMVSDFIRAQTIKEFGIDTVAPQWAAYLGVEVPQAVAA